MTSGDTDGLKFHVEIRRVLDILSREIYDSPLALLRENIQNAYDAVLMRHADDSAFPLSNGVIDVVVSGAEVSIADNGVGMTEETLRNNFWTAGSSGKRSDLARRAGVIGTFGIGAMANFGVCTSLRVETRAAGAAHTLVTIAERERLSLTEQCITLERIDDQLAQGTRVTATLDPAHRIDPAHALQYALQYSQYLPIVVRLNGTVISQKNYTSEILPPTATQVGEPAPIVSGGNAATVTLYATQGGQFAVRAEAIQVEGALVRGEILLVQGLGHVFALRNHFGLAPVPVSSHYQFGGIVDLAVLQPTAGREALTRESVDRINQLVRLLDTAVSEAIAATDFADRSVAFAQWVISSGRYDLADRITVDVGTGPENVRLGDVRELIAHGDVRYYAGRDRSLIESFAAGPTRLLVLAQTNPRRQLQTHRLQQLGVALVPDETLVRHQYSPSDLIHEEAALCIRIAGVMTSDYLVPEPLIAFADLSHGRPLLVRLHPTHVEVLLARDNAELRPILACYREGNDVFGGFVRDFVRIRLYPQFANAVPSATREGAEVLRRALERRRELFRYEADDFGSMDPLITEFIAGTRSLADVLASAGAHNPHVQQLTRESVRRVEDEIAGIVGSPVAEPSVAGDNLAPAPPILRRDSETTAKVLTVGQSYEQLNGHELFLGLADRVFRQDVEFFLQPHTTKILWGSHRVIFIFTHASGEITFYYDLEMREPLRDTTAGGRPVPTTTIVTKNRIYVPLPAELAASFHIQEGAKEFYVRYDYITT